MAAGFVKLSVEYEVYKGKVSQAPRSFPMPSASQWIVPPSNSVKVNVDAHIKSAGGVQFGAIIRDANGQPLVAAVKGSRASWAADMAEAGAIRYGVELARRLGYANVILESDALTVVRAIQDRKAGASPIFLLIDDVHKISNEFNIFMCVHVRRAGNTAAHSIARWETNGSSERICMNSFPQTLQSLVELNLI